MIDATPIIDFLLDKIFPRHGQVIAVADLEGLFAARTCCEPPGVLL